jgi:MerC mercury resistance protein
LPLMLSRRDPGNHADPVARAADPSDTSVQLASKGTGKPQDAAPEHAAHDGAQREWLDRIGIVLSVVCAIHCALTPILVAVAPFLFTSEFEFRTKAVLLSLAAVALGWGYVTHRSYKPIVWLMAALTAFGVGEWVGHGEWFEVFATVLASLALIMAHVTNARSCRVAAPHGHGVSWLRR